MNGEPNCVKGRAASRPGRCTVIQTLTGNWWLLALCGVLDALMAVIYFDHADHGFHAVKNIVLLGRIALAAGACTIAAGFWISANRKSWLLVVNGLAVAALGLIFNGIAGFKISFSTIAFLIILMAISAGILELLTARTLRRERHLAEGWLLGFAAVASLGFALAFFGLGFRWIKPQPGSLSELLWLGAYFGFTAVCMLGWPCTYARNPAETKSFHR
jgi:uncharacterized membrane protein HdeD (DUF308 family)